MMNRVIFTSLHDDYPEEEADEMGIVNRRWGQFKTSLSQTIGEIEYELDRVGAEDAVIEIDARSKDIRSNGFLRPGAETSTPRVRLTFAHPTRGVLQYPCSTYYQYEHNIRAIVLTLTALRAIERYGATKHGQQYDGWQQLPPIDNQERYLVTPQEAAEFVVETAGLERGEANVLLERENYFRFCYRDAVKNAHPDARGSDAKFKTLQSAKDILETYFRQARVA